MPNFPEGFLWGSSTSAHQVEGNNVNSDWWKWEQDGRVKYRSAAATNNYFLFEQDFDLLYGLHQNAHRFSIEWSRIQPRSGEFSQDAIAHYREVLCALRKRGITPVVTLHHFTNPVWFSEKGGWMSPDAADMFCRYVRKVTEEFSDLVRFWITINEPVVLCYFGYVQGLWPPGGGGIACAKKALRNLLNAHLSAYRAIREVYSAKYLEPPMISIAQNIRLFHPCSKPPRILNRFAVYLRDVNVNFGPLDFLAGRKSLDFLGINYYGREFLRFHPLEMHSLFARGCSCDEHSAYVLRNSLGWEIYPQGIQELLLKIKKYGLPVIITENGICTDDDNLRWYYISEHLKNIVEAMRRDVDVRGYFYWSLLDNFEWHEGFAPRFGLVDVDYSSFKRSIRKSALRFSEVCRTNSI